MISASVVRGYAARAHIASAIRKGRTVELKFMEQAQLDVSALLSLLKGYESCATLRRSNPPVIVFSLENGHKYSEMLQLLEQIKHCIS